ncbi:MAG: hypothetical protein QOJ99_2945 [Bryobacterales bacterium]|jgi:hypothetical protein|nr:hypothetical protein [Bryobacterales bacterium]
MPEKQGFRSNNGELSRSGSAILSNMATAGGHMFALDHSTSARFDVVFAHTTSPLSAGL